MTRQRANAHMAAAISSDVRRRSRRRPLAARHIQSTTNATRHLQRDLKITHTTQHNNHDRTRTLALIAVAAMFLFAAPALGIAAQQQQQPQPQQPQGIAALHQSLTQLMQVFNGNNELLLQQAQQPPQVSSQLAAAAAATTTASAASQQQLQNMNHFKLLEVAGDFVLVGARNVVYNLSLSTMREQRRLEWPSSLEDVSLCRLKGKSHDQCQNYIRVLKFKQRQNALFVCGTNAYKPRCRTYSITADGYEQQDELPGEGQCPYQENQNITSLLVDNDVYTATAAQFLGADGLLYRHPLRTEQFNMKQLNSPNFVASFRYGEHAYFLLRETAIEHMNCGKTVYSRIARVCLNDRGSSRTTRPYWTSFVKARLNCSIPGEFPFAFDEIQSSAQVWQSAGGANAAHDMLYAVFTTPVNSIGGSAVCAYRMSDVLEAFEGPFKGQTDSSSNWLPVAESRVPQSPRPGTCVNNSKSLPEDHANFVRDNPLMDTVVQPVYAQPLVMMASINFRFTQVAVDAHVETMGAANAQHMRTDVIFVATDDGRVFKLINTYSLYHSTPAQQPHAAMQRTPQSFRTSPFMGASLALQNSVVVGQKEPLVDVSSSTIVVEELHLFDARTPITNLLLHYPPSTSSDEAEQQHQDAMWTMTTRPKLIALSGKQIKAIPLARCVRALTCADCLALYDPYCAWDARQQVCASRGRPARSQPALHASRNWFPANQDPTMTTAYGGDMAAQQQQQQQQLNGSTGSLGWWATPGQCPSIDASGSQQAIAVGAPFRSLFSSHLQVPNRFDYASGHHLSHSSLISLGNSAGNKQPQLAATTSSAAQQPASECLNMCGGMYAPAGANLATANAADAISCADVVHQRYLSVAAGSAPSSQSPYANLFASVFSAPAGGGGVVVAQQQPGGAYTSENLYYAVIICACVSLIVGLVFGFAIGRQARKHADSSVCSSSFDETNLYMASTGSHGGGPVFMAGANANSSLHHRLQQQHSLVSHSLMNGIGARGSAMTQGSNAAAHADNSIMQGLLSSSDGSSSINCYGNQQQMLMHLTSGRSGALPPVPTQAQHNNINNNNNNQPLVNPSAASTTHIQPTQLSSGSSTNTSSTSATVPVSEHQNQYYQQQQQQQQLNINTTSALHQRQFSGQQQQLGANSPASIKSAKQQQQQKTPASYLLQTQQQLNGQQNNKIYL